MSASRVVGFNEDELVAKARRAYARAARRDFLVNGVSWPKISHRGWLVESGDDGKVWITANTHGLMDGEELARWRWSGSRLVRAKARPYFGD